MFVDQLLRLATSLNFQQHSLRKPVHFLADGALILLKLPNQLPEQLLNLLKVEHVCRNQRVGDGLVDLQLVHLIGVEGEERAGYLRVTWGSW